MVDAFHENVRITRWSEFYMSVESNSRLLWFCITTNSDWLKKTRATFSTNQK